MRNAVPGRRGWLFVAAVLILAPAAAHASLIISATSVSVAAGGSGSFDVNIQDVGGTQNIAAFSFGLSVASNSGITFTSGNESTANTYIFNNDSFDLMNSLPLTGPPPPPGPSVQASDLSNSGNGTNVGATTLGLGHILFQVAPGTAAGPVTVTIVPNCPSLNSCTSLSDNTGASVTGFMVSNGTITVTGAAVPEPSTLWLSLLAIPLLARVYRRLN